MAIDTEIKRKSVINNGLPGLALLPPPDGLIQAGDRRRLADFYALGSRVIPHNFWVPDKREGSVSWGEEKKVSSSNWVQDENASQSFSPDKRTSTTWVQDQDSNGDWKEDTEVPAE